MRTVTLTDGEQFDAVYSDVLVPSFPPDELDSLDTFRRGLRAGDVLGTAVLGDDGRPLAAMVGEWSPDSRVLLLSYLAVADGSRRLGIGGPLYETVLGRWRTEFAPCLILAEIEHPDGHESSPAYGDPAARLRFYGRHGASILRLPYFQPALRGGGSRVYGMLLLALHVDPSYGDAHAVDAGALRAFLTGYWEVEGGVGDDPATVALFSGLDVGAVPLLPTYRYAEVPVSVG